MPPIFIEDLLVQGHAGQVAQSKVGDKSTHPLVANSGTQSPDRIATVVEYIARMAGAATDAKQATADRPGASQITRLTTDEFSFYPRDAPFTLDEYKAIIKQTATIANSLPPDVHMVLATFPVMWADGGVHNCGLYVQAPTQPGNTPIIHHFSKKYHADRDFQYQNADGALYRLTTDNDCTEAQLPDAILKDTKEVLTGDVNQHGAAIKITTSKNDEYISTVGICLDHAMGVEKKEVQALIQQLQKHEKSIPMECSHVITSYSIQKIPDNIVSTVSHADPETAYRQVPTEPPKGFLSLRGAPPPIQGVQNILANPFSTCSTTLERYPAKPMGTLHSDLFLQASVRDVSLAEKLNTPDPKGDTELHRVISTTTYDNELLGKRLYAMILAGGDPMIRNHEGKTVMDLARDKSPIARSYVEAAISKIELRNHNIHQSLPERVGMVEGDLTSLPNSQRLKGFILQGGNPYQKGPDGQSALDLVKPYPPFDRVFLTGQLKAMFERANASPLTRNVISVAEELDGLLVRSPANFQRFLGALTREERKFTLEEIRGNLSIFFAENDEGKLALFLQSMRPQLPDLIGSFADFKALLEKLQKDEDRIFLFNAMKYQLHSFADYTPNEDLSTLLSESQIAWIKSVDSAGDDRQKFLGELYKVEYECNDLLARISAFRVLPTGDTRMDEFYREKADLIGTSPDLATMNALKSELQATLSAMQKDRITPLIIIKINELLSSGNPLTGFESRQKGTRILTALLNVPVANRAEIMNDAFKTPEVDTLRKELASHRISKTGSELNPDGTVNEATVASTYKELKSRYLAQRQEHHEKVEDVSDAEPAAPASPGNTS